MCDTYVGQCRGCEEDVPIHIGDFSAAREHVVVWCPDCHADFMAWLIAVDKAGKVFVERGFIFWCEDPHRIRLDG